MVRGRRSALIRRMAPPGREAGRLGGFTCCDPGNRALDLDKFLHTYNLGALQESGVYPSARSGTVVFLTDRGRWTQGFWGCTRGCLYPRTMRGVPAFARFPSAFVGFWTRLLGSPHCGGAWPDIPSHSHRPPPPRSALPRSIASPGSCTTCPTGCWCPCSCSTWWQVSSSTGDPRQPDAACLMPFPPPPTVTILRTARSTVVREVASSVATNEPWLSRLDSAADASMVDRNSHRAGRSPSGAAIVRRCGGERLDRAPPSSSARSCCADLRRASLARARGRPRSAILVWSCSRPPRP